MADKYIKDLTQTTDALVNADYMLVEKADNSGTKISQFSNIASSVANKILANNLTTTASGYALDARQGNYIDSAYFHGRANLDSSTTEDGLMSLPPGAYLTNTAFSWAPSGFGQYGTFISIQSQVNGTAGYGVIIFINTRGEIWLRHHTSSSWHHEWRRVFGSAIITPTPGTNVSFTGVVQQEGQMVYVGGTIQASGAVSAGNMLIGGIPKSSVNNIIVPTRDNATGNMVNLLVTSNGTITSQSAMVNGTSYRVSLSYPVSTFPS